MRNEVAALLRGIPKADAARIEARVYSILFPSGEEDTDTIDEYRHIMYNLAYIINKPNADPRAVLQEVLRASSLSDLHQAMYSNRRQLIDAQRLRDDFITNPMEVSEGVEKCPRCGCARTYSYQKQVRSADEGFTTFCTCANPKCRHSWRIN